MKNINFFACRILLIGILCLVPSVAFAQKHKPAGKRKTAVVLPKVTIVDADELKNLLKPNGKPLLVNFWATWCDPCREEFPDLVKIDNDYRGKIDFITVSLDDLDDLKFTVPKFLLKMKAKMPAYFLKTDDEEKTIGEISADWQGGLPFTILYNSAGKVVYSRQGKIKTDILRAEIDKTQNSNTLETQKVSPK
jgi:thiol-disulfide isomerase/thioredoxin